MIHYDCLLKNATDILLQNATAILLQKATKVCYKMRLVFIAKCDRFITKCDSYNKIRRLLQMATVDCVLLVNFNAIFSSTN